MALYSEDLQTELYKYSKPIYVSETSGQDRTLIPLKLNLNTANFNFDLPREDGLDFRLALKSNGTGVLLMWVAYWSNDDGKATLWFKLPSLLANETKKLWAFWGFSGDSGISDIDSMVDVDPVFLFADGFDDESLDIIKWPNDVDHRSGSWILNNSSIELSTDAWIRSSSALGGETSEYTGSHSLIIPSTGLVGRQTNCYLNLIGTLGTGYTTLINGVYKEGTYYGIGGGCDIGIDFGTEKINMSKFRLYIYNYTETYNSTATFASNSSIRVQKSVANNNDWEDVQTFNYEQMNPLVKVEDYVWYYELNFDSPGIEGRFFRFNGTITISPSFSIGHTEIEGFSRESDIFSNPGKFILEEGIVGINSPTSTTSYAHRVQFLEGENPFEIRYFWEGSIDRQHNFEDSDTVQTYNGTEKGLEIESYAQLYVAYYEDTDTIYQGMLNRDTYGDYEDSWERMVHRNTECDTFKLWGHDSSASDGVRIDWVVVREYDPDAEPEINLDELFIEYEYVPHQVLDFDQYQSDSTSVDFYHYSDMGGDPYRLSDNVSTGLGNVFISDGTSISGSVFIDFGRLSDRDNDGDYLHLSNSVVTYYNAAKLSDLEADEHGRNYWLAARSSNAWAAIKFPERKTIAALSVKAVPSRLSGMIKNYKFYGSNKDPRFTGFSEKVLIASGQFLSITDEQVVYLNNSSNYFYYILEAVDTYGANVAVQEWGLYRRTSQTGKKVISQLRLKPVVDTINEYYFPKQIQLLASNDLINWTILLDTTDTATPFTNYVYGRWQRFSFENYAGYYVYKLVCYDNWRAPDDAIKISEWEMVERIEEANVYRILEGSTDNMNNIWTASGTSYDAGHFYIVNDVINTVLVDELIEWSTVSGSVSDMNVIGS